MASLLVACDFLHFFYTCSGCGDKICCMPLEINMKDYFPAFRQAVECAFFRAAILAAVAWVMTNPASAQSRVADGTMSNLEALLNITCNGIEILGFVSMAEFVLGAIAVFIRKQWNLGYFVVGSIFAFFLFTLATPGFFNWMSYSGLEVDAMLPAAGACTIYALVWFVVYFAMCFMPAIVAIRRDHPRKNLLLAYNFLVFLPFVYPLLFWYVLKDEGKADEKRAVADSE